MPKGSNLIYPERMTDNDKKKISLMTRMAKDMKVEVKDMDAYNVFAPELRAREFVDLLVKKKGNLVATVRDFLPGYKNHTTEIVFKKGVKICTSLRVQELLNQVLETQGVSVDSIVSDIASLSKNAKRDADRLKALEMLGKFKNIFNDKKADKVVEYNLNISEDAARRLLERRDNYDIGQAGVFRGRNESDVINGEEVSDGLCDTDAEGVCTELASRTDSEEA